MTPALRTACVDAVHVIRPDGGVLRAGAGCLYVLEAIGWWWLRPFSWVPFIWLVELGYHIVATNRMVFNRFLFRSEDGP